MKLENIPNDCEFFRNAASGLRYKDLVKEFSLWLIGREYCREIRKSSEFFMNSEFFVVETTELESVTSCV